MVSEVSLADIAEMRRRPGFAAAMRLHARAIVTLFYGNSLLNVLMNDRARAIFMLVALYLHVGGRDGDGPGLTVGALKDLCVALDLCSRGRCEAMLALLRAAGYFEAVPHADRRRRLLAPTEKLFALQHARWLAHVGALEKIDPSARRHRAVLDDPAFVRAFVRELGGPYVAGFRLLDHAPDLCLFVDRNAGLPILFALALEGPEEGPFPPVAPVRLSINALATRFAVSRKHVLTLLRDAERDGLVLRGPEQDRITMLPRLRDGFESLLATILVYVSRAAERASVEVGAAELAS